MTEILPRHLRSLLAALALAAVLPLGLLPGGPAQASRPPWARADTLRPAFPKLLVSAQEAAGRRRETQWLDARPRAEFVRGHIPGALSVDPSRFPRDAWALAAALGAAGVRSDRELLCYSDGPHTAAAGQLLWLLEVAGARRVTVLNGGIEAWRAAGGAVETGDVTARAVPFVAQPDTSRWADDTYVRQVAGRRGYEILESRSEAEWERGHIPHALPFPVDSLWGRSVGMRPGQELWDLFSQFGPRPQDPISLHDEILICMEDGEPSALSLYLATRQAGLPRVRGYAGGFTSWHRDETAPVVRIVQAEEVRAKVQGPTWWQKIAGRRAPQVLVFDVRSQRDYEIGHLPGAVSLPSHLFADQFESFLAEHWPSLDRARTTLLFYCYGPTCIRSRHCSSIASQHGFRNLLWFRAGIEGWYAIGERLVRD